MKNIIKYILWFLLVMIIFCILLIISYELPDESIRSNVYCSLNTIVGESDYFRPFFEKSSVLTEVGALDNYTDAIILNIALDRGKELNMNVYERAFSSLHFKYNNDNQCKNLIDAFDEQNIPSSSYTRYWFGIETILRFLLLVFSLEEIRYINMIVMFLLLFIAFYILSKKTHIKYALSFVISVILMNFFVIPMSIQYSPVMYIMLISEIFILLNYNKQKFKENIIYFFILIGALTAYMDLLTYPLITLGFPLITMLLLEINKEKLDVKKITKCIIKISIAWGLSYAMSFIFKWIISSIILKQNVIEQAVEQLNYRLNINSDVKLNRGQVINANLKNYFNIFIQAAIIIYLFIWSSLMAVSGRISKTTLKNIIPYVIVMGYPFVWYCLIPNHSIEHPWMTYKILSVTMFAFLSITQYLLNIEKVKKAKNNIVLKGKV